MDKTLKITSINTIIQRGTFGSGKYYGYNNFKVIGLVRIKTNKKIDGVGESLVGVYSPNLLKINLNFVSNLIINKNIKQTFDILNNLQKNKFFFDSGILKSIIASIEMALFDIMAQSEKQSLRKLFSVHFKEKNFKNNIPVYASAGSILGSLKDLKKEISISKKKGFNLFKARISLLNSNYFTKIKILKDEIKNFSIDLISNTYEKNSNLKLIQKFLEYLKKYNPVWIEEILSKNDLHYFKKIRKNNLSFSYGENFNSLNDFVNLINFYKFHYINPDISHFTISDFYHLINYMRKNNLKKKIIMHCWGGNINLYNSLSLASVFEKYIKLVEFPVTDFSLNNLFLKNANITNSNYYFENNILKNNDLIKINSFKIKTLKSFTFNY